MPNARAELQRDHLRVMAQPSQINSPFCQLQRSLGSNHVFTLHECDAGTVSGTVVVTT